MLSLGVVSKNIGERRGKVWSPQPVTGLFELRRIHPLAYQQQRVSHLSQCETQRKRRCGKEGGPVQSPRQNAREFVVLNRVRSHGIRWAGEARIFNRAADHANSFRERQPRHPLPPAPELTTRAQFEWQSHPRQRASVSRKDDSESQYYHARAEFSPALTFRFPRPAERGKKIAA